MNRLSALAVAVSLVAAGCSSDINYGPDGHQPDVHGDVVAGQRGSTGRER